MSVEPKVTTYLLGAGASAQCLPVVCNMAAGVKEVHDIFYNPSFLKCKKALHPQLKIIFNELRQLEEICKRNYSIDTYAKKLLISGKTNEYEKLKDILSVYFTLQQKVKPLDNRYDNFWAALLTRKYDLPDNIRVVSWNYDSQIELSYREFAGIESLSESYSRLNMVSPHTDHDFFNTEKFSVIKLNGSAKYKEDSFLKSEFKYLSEDYSNQIDDENFYVDLLEAYEDLGTIDKKQKKRFNKNELTFAWEHKFDSRFNKKIKESLKNTTVMVVIGYSFPIYNRKVDKMIINDYMPNLEKVYLQAPDAVDLEERFVALNSTIDPEQIILKKDIGQFVFPNELDI
ncbi:hypothetical protein [Pedobacter nyackensis]|uniref:hypothetical protein n=1 Tax=Pedobacter nyackensis TaxID=475255 RepID=UPI00292E2347|nr:hypothetical protein [Pedobacter nyackensis]